MPDRETLVRSAAKGLAGLTPAFGSLVAEAVDVLVPNKKAERFQDLVLLLNQKIIDLEADVERLDQIFREGESLDLFEEAGVQAFRAVSRDRRDQLAAILANSLLDDEAEYDRSKKIFAIFRELTDSEVIWLKSRSLQGQEKRDFDELHAPVVRPASRSVGASRSEADRRAVQDAYKQTLVRLGLVELGSTGQAKITALGRLLLRYIEVLPDGDKSSG